MRATAFWTALRRTVGVKRVKLYLPAGDGQGDVHASRPSAGDVDQLHCLGDVKGLQRDAPMLPGVAYELFLDYWQLATGSAEGDILHMGNRLCTFLRGAAAVDVHLFQNDVLKIPKDQSAFDCSILLEKMARKRVPNFGHRWSLPIGAYRVHMYTHRQYHSSRELLLDVITLISGPIDGKAARYVCAFNVWIDRTHPTIDISGDWTDALCDAFQAFFRHAAVDECLTSRIL